MKTLKEILYLACVTILITSSFSTDLNASDVLYTTLGPIENFIDPTLTISDGGGSFGEYLNDMYRLGIALCGALAVLMIVIGGVQYVSSDAWTGKEAGKERITAALLGLAVALGSYAMLMVLNPNLLNTTLSISPILVRPLTPEEAQYLQNGYVQSPTGSSTTMLGPGGEGSVPTGKIVPMTGINVQASGKGVDSSMVAGLQGMKTELDAAGISWTVTEGHPPSRSHQSDCHRLGTCVDVDFLGGNDSPERVNALINAGNNNGMHMVWEVESDKDRDRLIAGGVPADRVLSLPGKITGSHASAYSKQWRNNR